MNLGDVDMAKLYRLAKISGITKDELDKALAERRLTGLKFQTSFYLI